MDRNQKIIITLSVCLGLIFISIIVFQQIAIMPKLKPMEAVLESEFQKIHQMPNVKELNYSTIVKPEIVSVGSNFKADSSFETISQYYLIELPKRGWKFKSRKNTTVLGKDLGGKELTFVKGQYELILNFPGNDPSFNYTYDEEINWHPR